MCGIAGVLGLGADLGPADRAQVRGMTSVLFHRGPDSTGYFDAERCVFGNTRLNILDLSSAADLPMASADAQVHIAYNGEVTNWLELKEEFGLDKKYAFRTSSDTEVLLHLYEELGIDFVKHLTGQFAFALHDARKRKAWVVRDPYGIRPMFVMRGPDRLYFASEIKSFLELPHFDGKIDHEGLYHFFTLAYIPGKHTPFQQIEELQGARLIEVDLAAGDRKERSYYEPRYRPNTDIGEVEFAELLYEQMRDSVRRNLISDAPIGMTLSGGFDTSSILSLAREVVGEDTDLHTFSIVMDEPSFDESKFQHIMAEYCKTTHHEIRVGQQDVMDNLVQHMAFMDEPSGDGAAVPSFILAKEAAKYVRVLLSGEGGDETFTAYETHRAWKARKLYRSFVPKPLRDLVRVGVHALPTDYRKLSFDFVAKRFTEGSEMTVPESHLHWRYTLSEKDKRQLMPGCAEVPPTATIATELFESADAADDLDRISVVDLKTYFIGDLMVKNDRTIMAHSIETRFPYMDKTLFDFASTMPSTLRLKGFKGRYMQKLAMKGRVPDSIYRRKNFGLEMPHSLWFLDKMQPMVERYFAADNVAKTEFLHVPTVERLWREHRERKHDHGRALWSLLNLLIWFDLFVSDKSYKRYLR